MRKKHLLLALFSLSLVINILVLFTFFQNSVALEADRDFKTLQKQYPLLAKRILNENFSDIILNFLDLRTDLKSTVAPWGNSFSFYFEYLPTGTSIGVNEKEEFYAASLFKVPVVMAYYHQLEKQKSKEDPILTIRAKDINKEFGNLWKKGVGYKIRMSEAIKLALQESDNTAIELVVPRITEDDFRHVYDALDIDLVSDGNGAKLTTKGYSSILKALFFSSALTKGYSQEILNYLSKTIFVDKLPAGVPNNIIVAHKIGVFNKNHNQEEAFMDCGIVYVPDRRYILCMLSISDEQTARERMSMISKKVYDYVSSQ